LEEERVLDSLTTCRECIKLRIVVPRECRLNADILAQRVSELFKTEVLRDLCHGCPLEVRQE
jgi:hypothetical protein